MEGFDYRGRFVTNFYFPVTMFPNFILSTEGAKRKILYCKTSLAHDISSGYLNSLPVGNTLVFRRSANDDILGPQHSQENVSD